jgi:hypothetical protein
MQKVLIHEDATIAEPLEKELDELAKPFAGYREIEEQLCEFTVKNKKDLQEAASSLLKKYKKALIDAEKLDWKQMEK